MVIVVLTVAIILVTGVLLHILFDMQLSKLTLEMLATLIAVVMVVASVAVTLYFQSEYEVDREFKSELFKQRILTYYKLLSEYSKMDDDGVIQPCEKEKMLNLARSVALIASPRTVFVLSNYVNGIIKTGRLYLSDEEAREHSKFLAGMRTPVAEYLGTFRNLVSCMRDDLKVVEDKTSSTTEDSIKEAIASIVRRQTGTKDQIGREK